MLLVRLMSRQRRYKKPGIFVESIGEGPSAVQGLPEPVELELPKRLAEMKWKGQIEPDLKMFRLGDCVVMVGSSKSGWHMSISHKSRLPTWDEVVAARYALIPDGAVMAMLLPPKAEYIDMHKFTFHLWQTVGVLRKK